MLQVLMAAELLSSIEKFQKWGNGRIVLFARVGKDVPPFFW